MEELLAEVAHIQRKRDLIFIEQFCQKGAYLDEHGNIVNGVCRMASANEVLEFQHQTTALIIEAIKKL